MGFNTNEEQYVGQEHVSPPDRPPYGTSDARLLVREIDLKTGRAGTYMSISVPAEYASFKLPDSLLSRLSNDGRPHLNHTSRSETDHMSDSMERSLSTFATEMATSAMILGMST